MKKTSKIMAMFLSVIMVFAMAPCMAFANENVTNEDAADQFTADPFAQWFDGSGESFDLFGVSGSENSLADDGYKFVRIKMDFGSKHKAIAKQVYNNLKEMIKQQGTEMPKGYKAPSLKGSVLSVSFTSSMPAYIVGEYAIFLYYGNFDEYQTITDAGMIFTGMAGTKRVSGYKCFDDMMRSHATADGSPKPIKNKQTYYMHWYKPVTIKMDITVDAPICGSDITYQPNSDTMERPVQNNKPVLTIPENSAIYAPFTEKYAFWRTDSNVIEGDQEYMASITLMAKYGYYINSDSELTMNGQPFMSLIPVYPGSVSPYDGLRKEGGALIIADHAWDKGTPNGDGTFTYECTYCHATKTEEPQKAADGTDLGKGASVQAADAAITGMTEDVDPVGTAFDPLKLRSTKQAKTTATLKWQAVGGAASYLVYGSQCGNENKMVKLDEVTAPTYVAKTLKKGTYYKFMVVALGGNNKVLASSRLIHVGTKGGKTGNYKSVTIKVKKGKKFKKASAATVDVGSALQTKVALKKAQKKLKKHVGVRYESSDAAIATVDESGVITGVALGECKITAYAQNGVYKVLKLTVK